jgi:hypothetical protein
VIARMQAAVQGLPVPADPGPAEVWTTALTQYQRTLVHYGSNLGRRVVRKHLGWYAEHCGGSALRARLVRESDPEPLLQRLAAGELAEAA